MRVPAEDAAYTRCRLRGSRAMGSCVAATCHDTWTGDELLTALLRLGAAAILGAVLGLERQREHKTAGARTHMLVCLGAALFVVAPASGGIDETALSRVIQGITAGVGFLGAGAILKADGEHQVHGLTTAASIWITAGAGVAVGAGYLLAALAAVALAWLILRPFRRVEDWLHPELGRKPPEERPKRD